MGAILAGDQVMPCVNRCRSGVGSGPKNVIRVPKRSTEQKIFFCLISASETDVHKIPWMCLKSEHNLYRTSASPRQRQDVFTTHSTKLHPLPSPFSLFSPIPSTRTHQQIIPNPRYKPELRAGSGRHVPSLHP